MKRLLTLTFIIVATIGTALYFLIGPVRGLRREPIKDLAVFYIDSKQLVEDSNIDAYLNEENRRLIATSLSSEIGDSALRDHLSAIATNPDNSGLWLSRPIYAYVNESHALEYEGAIVAEVNDVAKLDLTMQILGQIAEKDGMTSSMRVDGNIRKFSFDEVCGGYNNERLVITIASKGSNALLSEALSRPLSDLSIFEGHDAALYLDINRASAIYTEHIKDEIKENKRLRDKSDYDFEREVYESNIASLEEHLARLNTSLETLLDKSASMLTTLNFDPGNIRLASSYKGVNAPDGLLMEANNDNLRYVSEDLSGVINIGTNGAVLSKYISEHIPSNLSAMLGGLRSNEFSLAVQVGLDALSSIDGDLTIAVGEICGSLRGWGYAKYANMDSIDLLAMAEVKDNYIFDNIKLFAGNIFTTESDGSLSVGVDDDINAYVGQLDTKFYAGLNLRPEEVVTPALTARWFDKVEGGAAYAVIDIELVMCSSYVEALMAEWKSEVSGFEYDLVDVILGDLDYIYIRTNTDLSSELVVEFDNKEKNSLEQIVDVCMGYYLMLVASGEAIF